MEIVFRSEKSGFIRTRFSEEEFRFIISLTPQVKDSSRKSIMERVYCIENNIFEIPFCKECGKEVNFVRSRGGYYGQFCSNICGRKNNDTLNKQKKTCLEKYGVENPAQSISIRNKMQETSLERYGNEFFNNRDSAKQTCLEKYGVENPTQTKEVQDKIKQTCLEKYGETSHFKNKQIALKRTLTFLKNYGFEYPSQSQEVKDKISISKSNRFQERRNTEGTDYSGFVYILHFPDLQAVKIGLASNFENRAKGLKKDFGDFSIIKVIETEKCFQLESELHEKFSDFRICLNEGNGRTEFFKEEILEDM